MHDFWHVTQLIPQTRSTAPYPVARIINAMRFWFIHSGEVSIREQIVTQITLGILSEELAPGERLPSTRELAHRFHLHANTVSAAYQQLESEGWVTSRRGSGVFVRDHRPT
jgi:DNA-binding transcriptional regulator YhcF (GntR family)